MRRNIAVLCCLVLFAANTLQAQTCSFTVSTAKICLGTTVSLTPASSGGTPIKYNWSYGDSNLDSVQNPSYKYQNPGTYTINLTITFSGGATCQATPVTVKVFPLPVADLSLQSFPLQCYGKNFFCFKDQSVTTAAPLLRRTLLFGDGAADNTTPVSQKIICHNYGAIGVFSPVIEVVDTNGCISRKELKNTVRVVDDVFPQFSYIKFGYCGHITVTFLNDTLSPLASLRRFLWDFGDGTYDSTSWFSVTHNYDTPGNFAIKLIFESIPGCIDTFTQTITNQAYYFNFTHAAAPLPNCPMIDKVVNFSASYIPDVYYNWVFYDSDTNYIFTKSGQNISHAFTSCGNYFYKLALQKDSCDSITDYIPFRIKGPTARIELASQQVTNKYQCLGTDTVFVPPNNIHYSKFCSNAVKLFWDFGDPYAPNCTTNTKAGINVGMNCNFSVDSVNVKHKYRSNLDTCYFLKLKLVDTITGCWDIDSTQIVVGKPLARMYAQKPYCLYQNIRFSLLESKPECDKQEVWFMPDSVCTSKQWYRMPKGEQFFWAYPSTCDGSGWVTTGLVIRNGACYDTTWYHHMLYFKNFDSRINVIPTRSCDSMHVYVSFVDSLQKGIKKVVWEFAIGVRDTDTLSTYTQLPSNSHTYYTKGVHTIIVTMTNDSGCTKFDYKSLALGHLSMIKADTLACVGQYVLFRDSLHYFNAITNLDPIKYWRMAQPRPEKVYWDFDDGNTATGPLPVHVFKAPGIYKVKMIALDKFDCWDTTIHTIRVRKPVAGFSVSDTLLVCGQIVRFYDSSFVNSGFPGNQPLLDSIRTWQWDFGDGKTFSYLKNPYHDYTSFGLFNIRLKASVDKDCYDTVSHQIRIKGPLPSFEVSSDTIGCVPFTATFKNTSADTKYWIWDYGDSTVYSSVIHEDVQHTYTKPGVYEISVFGVDSFKNPITQNLYFCSNTYPPYLQKIRIHVLPLPLAGFTYKTPVCVGEPVFFKDSSSSVYTRYRWFMPSGDSTVADFPDKTGTYTFNQPGTFLVSYQPTYTPSPGVPYCPQQATHSVDVHSVKADFDIDSLKSKAPLFCFTNKSKDAVTYLWDFGQLKSGALNNTFTANPCHNYSPDSGFFQVCLLATSIEGCRDTICKPVHNDFFPFLMIPNVFTPANHDRINDAFDIPIVGETFYHIRIYNRWGELVFESNQDGDHNDGINWNGRLHNSGNECPDGTYFFVFDYSFIGPESQKQVAGSITLIRDGK